MATEYDDALHWLFFMTGTTLTSQTGKYLRGSELVLAALRASGFLDNMVDGIAPPTTEKLWLDKNSDPAVLKEYDPVGAAWVKVTSETLFGRVPFRGDWEPSPIYRVGDLVFYGTNIWIARLPSQNHPPEDDAYWDIFIDGSSYLSPETGLYRFETIAEAQAAHIPAAVQRVYIEEREAWFIRTGVDAGLAGFTNIDGGFWRIDEKVLRPVMFDIDGDGSNEQTKLQALIDYAVGKTIRWELGKTYGYNFLVVPDDVAFEGTGFTFRRLNANSSAGFRINNWFRAEYLRFSSPGGTGGDKCVRIQGSNNTFKYFHAEADAEGNESSSNWAIEMQSNPAGTTLSRNIIEAGYCRNYSSFLVGNLLSFINYKNVVIEKYRTAVYLIDTVRSQFSNFRIRGLGAAVNGAPGENGFLFEATSPGATADIVLDDCIVEDSGEHAYRLGGQQTIARITFNRCEAWRPGSSILSGNLSSGEWHGGCGFKLLGGGTAGGTMHEDIVYNECKVYDVNQTFGSYPTGHGTNNFTPFYITLGKGVQLNGCIVDGKSLSTSCRNGLYISCSNGVFVNNCDFRKCELTAIKTAQEPIDAGFPGYEIPLVEFHVRGGKFEVVTASAGSGVVYYMADAAIYAHKKWTIKGAEFRGGATALRVESVGGGGSYSGCLAEFTYLDPTSVTDAAATSPAITGNGVANWVCNFASFDRPLAFGISAANGSVHTRIDTAKAYDRVGGTWYERLAHLVGGYTPTATINTNLDAVTPAFTNYSRIGNVVHLFGRIDFDPTATGTISARITLPIAFDLTASRQAGGTFNSPDGTIHGSISADTTNDQLTFAGTSSVTSTRACAFIASYVVA